MNKSMTLKKYDSHHIDTEQCVENIGNRFNLVLVASARAKELHRGHRRRVQEHNSPVITALREIENGLVGKEYLKKV